MQNIPPIIYIREHCPMTRKNLALPFVNSTFTKNEKISIKITWGANEPMTLLVENPERLPDLVLDLRVLDFPEKQKKF